MTSRKITPNPDTATIFADEFNRGKNYETWRPQGSGDWLLIYTVAGSGAIGLPGGTYHTRPGDLLLYEPGAAQDYRTAPEAGRWRLRWAHFHPRPAWHEWLSWHERGPHIRLARLAGTWRKACLDALGRTIRAARRPGPIQVELALCALEEAILCAHAAQAKEQDTHADRRIDRAMSRLIDGFKQPFQLPALARDCGLSVSRLAFLFRRQTGKTPGQFLEEQRLSHAAHLLRRTSLTIGEIAGECGFADAFYFTNRFRRRHGMSPTQFRGKARRR
ncbi:MAG TPA: helix-turn-helix domain-containing protein [Candidatus Methylacidiphilales bacterium]|jgi:AraC family transcriptional regulator of arabinose operon|nr:helix-turn-helix domain-containing protein [Candidatus Methylacidiphilales bacterium]